MHGRLPAEDGYYCFPSFCQRVVSGPASTGDLSKVQAAVFRAGGLTVRNHLGARIQ